MAEVKPTIREIEADLADDGKPRAISIAADGSISTVEVHGLDNARQVFFYEQDFYVLSNFSAFNLRWRECTFPTSEHAYHWMKFFSGPTVDGLRASIAESIRFAPSAHVAFKLAEESKRFRRQDWDDVKVDIMRDILREKADQHEYVRRKLLATGERELIENSWRDDFWGWGPNHDGQNMLGRLWMEIRSELRAKPRPLEEILPAPPASSS
jgi:ribA/ribD-fused uncharacterized protein